MGKYKTNGFLKNNIKELIVFSIVFIVYNVLVLVIPFKKGEVFTIAYAFALISIIAFAASYIYAFDMTKALKEKFLSIPVFRVGCIYLATQLVVSTLIMFLTQFLTIYTWIAIVLCVLLLSVAVVTAMIINIASNKMTNIELNKETNTSFIRSLQADVKALSNRALEENIKLKLSKTAESVKYSDPVSNDALAEIEAKMSVTFDKIKSAVNEGNNDVEALINELDNLLSERNAKCRITKSECDI